MVEFILEYSYIIILFLGIFLYINQSKVSYIKVMDFYVIFLSIFRRYNLRLNEI
ncbi:hypothetical protein LEP1GSC007_0526 [Leptospira interrogans serovar Bulgarica str. Mallika]|nr:hypothetical protein LEP1GSC007_0526 [Leptospira interrogans serovar Bulgarica str. Mallika]